MPYKGLCEAHANEQWGSVPCRSEKESTPCLWEAGWLSAHTAGVPTGSRGEAGPKAASHHFSRDCLNAVHVCGNKKKPLCLAIVRYCLIRIVYIHRTRTLDCANDGTSPKEQRRPPDAGLNGLQY